MNKLQIVLSLVAVIFGVLVMAISLTSTSPAFSAQENLTASQRQLYWSSAILPDHVFYPVLAMVDRVHLETAPPLERVVLQQHYSRERYIQAELLLDKDNPDLALTTLMKSQLYLLLAVEEGAGMELSELSRGQLLQQLEIFELQLQEIKPRFNDAQQAEIEQMRAELQAVKLRLNQSLSS